jgi:hypothetical protein
VLGVPVRVTAMEAEAFERRLARAYSQASQSPAYVADAIGWDMDLAWCRRCGIEDRSTPAATRQWSA